ncbi:hypothetical protein [Rhizobium aethiopicum]|uniref:hypothetical protein n=1 Tax=Rhizobium aethiopicum TaxID=1138170 RepID=UPI0016204C14
MNNSPSGSLALEDLVEAFIKPVVARAMGGERGASSVRILREMVEMWVHLEKGSAPTAIHLVAGRWISAILKACPDLSRSEGIWAYSLMPGSTFSSHLLDRWLDGLVPPNDTTSEEQVTAMLVSFCTGGITGIMERNRSRLRTFRASPKHSAAGWPEKA